MSLFGPPNVEKMKNKKDIPGLQAILLNENNRYGKGTKFNELRARSALALNELGWQPPTNLKRAFLYVWLKRWDDVVACGEEAYEPLMEYYEITYDKNLNSKIYQILGDIGNPRACRFLEGRMGISNIDEKSALRALCLIYLKHRDQISDLTFVGYFPRNQDNVIIEAIQTLAQMGGENSVHAVMAFPLNYKKNDKSDFFSINESPLQVVLVYALMLIGVSAIEPLRQYEKKYGKKTELSRIGDIAALAIKFIEAYANNSLHELFTFIFSRENHFDSVISYQVMKNIVQNRGTDAIAPLTQLFNQNLGSYANGFAAEALADLNCPSGIRYFLDRGRDDVVQSMLEKAASEVSEDDLLKIAHRSDGIRASNFDPDIEYKIDRAPLRSLATQELQRRGLPLFRPFKFRNGQEASSLLELVELCRSSRNDALYHFEGGHFEPWLDYIERHDLAISCLDLREKNEGVEMGLDQFVKLILKGD